MGDACRILILEGAAAGGEVLESVLRSGGIAFESKRVQAKEAFLKALADFAPQLILADYQILAFEGAAVMAMVQDTCPKVPLIFVGAASVERDLVEALKKGATDYVLQEKPSRLVPAVLRTVRELQVRQEAEKALQASVAHLRAMAESAVDAIISINSQGHVVFWNRGAERMFGYSAGEMVGKAIRTIIPLQFQDAHQVGMSRLASGRESSIIGKTVELAGVRKEGREFPMELSLSTWRTGEGVFFSAVIRDISERKQAEEMLRSLSTLDELTGLYNRRGFLSQAGQFLEIIGRADKGAILLLADLDGLKGINDTQGHPAGDRALTAIATVLKETFRQVDILARLGGDEFAVLAMETSEASAEKLSARIQEHLRTYNQRNCLNLSLSVGIARYDREHGPSLDELLARADADMYAQKRAKRTR